MENGREIKMVITPKKSILYYFIRNAWIIVMYLIILFLSIFFKIAISKNGGGEGLNDIFNKVLFVSFVSILIVYIYNTIKTYIQTRIIQYTFFDNYIEYSDNFWNREKKQISYEHITEVRIKQPVLDRILKTGTIHLVTPVAQNSGIFFSYIENPDDVAEKIRNLIERK